MTDSLNPFGARLTRQEEIKFRELVDKILVQQSLPEVLEPSEREELFQLLQKLGLDQSLVRQNQERNELLIKTFKLLSIVTFSLAFVGIAVVPTVAIWIATNSHLLTGFSLLGLVFLSCMGALAFFGRFQWSWFFTVAFFITFFLVVLPLVL